MPINAEWLVRPEARDGGGGGGGSDDDDDETSRRAATRRSREDRSPVRGTGPHLEQFLRNKDCRDTGEVFVYDPLLLLAHFCTSHFFFTHRFGWRTAENRRRADGLGREQCTPHGKSAASTASGIDSVRRHVTYRCSLVADPIEVNVAEKPRRDASRGRGGGGGGGGGRGEEDWRTKRQEDSEEKEGRRKGDSHLEN
ncbi:uncharacterized protein LOC120356873 [Solenopsis invicta]|uniref:uncharacterized protein LOC120356873 n=1 Tax=Solenopsis invicta TaxID=13686 RepID=UPI00193D8406|nr:uncharacterized protein LOC120356873 [Solenopsis invicta]